MKTIMKFKKMEPSKKIIRLLSLFSLIFGIVALIWLIYDYVLYHKLRLTMLETTELGKLEIFGGFVWISYLYMFIYHILANGTLILYTRYFRRIQVLQVIALMLGVVSFLSLFGDWAVLGDIGKEYKMGWDISGEWKILNIFLGILDSVLKGWLLVYQSCHQLSGIELPAAHLGKVNRFFCKEFFQQALGVIYNTDRHNCIVA